MFIAVGDEGGQGVHVSMLDHRDLIRLKERTRVFIKTRNQNEPFLRVLFDRVSITIAYM